MTCNCDLTADSCAPYASLQSVQAILDIVTSCCKGELTTPGLDPSADPGPALLEAFPNGIGLPYGCECDVIWIVDTTGAPYLSVDDGATFCAVCISDTGCPLATGTYPNGTLPIDFENVIFGGNCPNCDVIIVTNEDSDQIYISINNCADWIEIGVGGATNQYFAEITEADNFGIGTSNTVVAHDTVVEDTPGFYDATGFTITGLTGVADVGAFVKFTHLSTSRHTCFAGITRNGVVVMEQGFSSGQDGVNEDGVITISRSIRINDGDILRLYVRASDSGEWQFDESVFSILLNTGV